jgi:6-phosphogluconolactonase
VSVSSHIHPDAQAAADACAQQIIARLEQSLAAQLHATLAVSGGSTPKLLFRAMVASGFRWDRVHLFWVDERAVPPDDAESNYRLAAENLIVPARIPAAQVHRIPAELPPEEAASRYVEDIRGFFGLQPGELPQFDVLQCGMGPDVHTASLFPGEPLIDNRDRIAAAVYVPKFGKWRITLLPGAILAAKDIVFLVAGEDKAQGVHQVFHHPLDPKLFPAQLISRQGRQVTWFLDKAAAAELV